MLQEMREFVKRNEAIILLCLVFVLSSLLSFGIGYLTARRDLKGEVHIIEELR